MSNKTIATLLAGAVLLGGTTVALAYTGENLAKDAKITMRQARALALKARPGRVTDTELERENGGLRYSFDVKSGRTTYEVGIDALTGRVLENGPEGSHPD